MLEFETSKGYGNQGLEVMYQIQDINNRDQRSIIISINLIT